MPPAPPSDHIAAVAPPPKEPPKTPVVPLWHIAAIAPPTFTVGVALIATVLSSEVVPHEPPLVVRVNVTVAGAVADAV